MWALFSTTLRMERSRKHYELDQIVNEIHLVVQFMHIGSEYIYSDVVISYLHIDHMRRSERCIVYNSI